MLFCFLALVDNVKSEKGLGQPLLMNSTEAQEDEGDHDCEGSEISLEESQPATSIASAYRLLTPSVKVVNACDISSLFFFTYNWKSVTVYAPGN